MFCPECGSSIEDKPKFCPQCGTELEYVIEEEDASGAEEGNEPTTSMSTGREASAFDGASLRDSVRFAKGLTEPLTSLPQKQDTGNELLDGLDQFAGIYHVYIDNCVGLLKVAQEKDALEKAGYTWYYGHSDDAVIQASRQISAEIDDSQKALKSARSSIAANKKKRAEAEAKRDDVKSESQRKVAKAGRKASRRTGCLVVFIVAIILSAVWAFSSALSSSSSAQYGGQGGVALIVGAQVVFYGAIAFWIYKKVKAKKKTTEKAATNADRSADARFKSTMGQLAKSDADLAKQASDLEAKIDELLPIAGEIKHTAMERSQFLYDIEMLDLSELMTAYSEACMAQHAELVALGTIPDEDEWFEVDRIAKFVRSGRADTMKEALQLLDTTNYRDKDLALKQQMVEGQQMTNMILGAGFSEVLKKQQEMIDIQRSAFSEMQEKMDVQHAQSMLAQAAQIKKQSELIQKQSEQNSHLEGISSHAAKQSAFNEEVRDRFNWTDENRPDRDVTDRASVGRNRPGM